MQLKLRALGARLVKFLLTYGPAFLILMLPALFNKFPLVYFDTGTYLAAAIHRFNPVDRPFHYSAFLYVLHLGRTLWPIVAAQAALTVAVLAILFDVSLGPLRALPMTALVALSAAVSSLPVLVSEVMPDLFTPLLVCSLAVLALHSPALTNLRKVFLYAVVLLAICVHQANFLIACALLLILVLLRSRLKPSLAGPLIAVCVGFGLLILPGVVSRHHRSFSPTRGGSVIMMAKLLEDGIGFDYLNEKCKAIPFSICAELPILQEERKIVPNADSLDFFLWGGPLDAAGGWEEVRKYAGLVDVACIFRYPGRFILASIRDSGRQSILLYTGEDIVRYGNDAYVSTTLKGDFPGPVYNQFQRSRQQSGSLNFLPISVMCICFVILSVVVLGIFAKSLLAGDKEFAATILLLLAGFLVNALVMGTLGHPQNRYQNRVSCLIPLAAIMVVAHRLQAAGFANERLLRTSAQGEVAV
jgi:hypothetical protein